MAGAINEDMKDFIEEWESVSPAQNYYVRLDPRGDEVFQGVSGARKFRLSTYERILTQDRIQDDKLDPFRNGSFRPLVVPKDVSIDTNPNALSDEDIDRIFKASDVAWDEYMKIINSPGTLKRMVDLAENAEITLRRFRELQKRLDEVDTSVKRIVQKDQELYESIPGGEPRRGPGRPPKAR
jgi:hypothetical protein